MPERLSLSFAKHPLPPARVTQLVFWLMIANSDEEDDPLWRLLSPVKLAASKGKNRFPVGRVLEAEDQSFVLPGPVSRAHGFF